MKKLLLTISVALCLGIATPVMAQDAAVKPATMSQPAPAAAPAMAPEAPMPASMAPVATMAPGKSSTAKAAPAAPKGKKDHWGLTLLGGLIQILLLFVLSFLVMLGRVGIKWLSKKVGLTNAEMTKQIEELYEKAVAMGINYASQQAYKLRDDPDSAGRRIDWATEAIMKAIKDMGLPEKSAGWVRNRIEAKIGETERGSEKTEKK
jgi:hypothetical protein